MQKANIFVILFTAAALGLAACGGGESSNETATPAAEEEAAPEVEVVEVSAEAQIGPVTELELGAYDAALAATGEAAFTAKCTACHTLEAKVIGPALGGVVDRRSPVYVMNMILNPTQMLAEHPVAILLLEEFIVPMVPLGIEETEARAIVEFLRGEG